MAAAAILVGGSPASAASLDAPLKPVAFDAAVPLRQIVADSLGDPDLWPLVLKLSGIESVDRLVPGAVLLMPVEQVSAVDNALAAALSAIQAATAEGARLFAPDEIAAALESHEQAVEGRSNGAWRDSVDQAGRAQTYAGEALTISLAQRDRAAEALITDVHGDVEGRAPAQSAWAARAVNDALVEFERVRTLSDSTAQITFRDLSRLRLNPNSNATIQTMRSDPLTGTEVTKVNLVSGDFYALLNQVSDRTAFSVEVDGRETRTESSDFWIQNDDAGARYANYDTAALEIDTGGGSVSLGRNEGAVVDTNGQAQVTDVLPRPNLAAPGEGEVVYGTAPSLAWEPTEGAAGYWVEVAADAAFGEMRISEWGVTEPTFAAADLAPGRYHWRIAALDAFGLPGEFSVARQFDLTADSTPPFLVVRSPLEGSLLAADRVTVDGETEPGAVLTLDGTPLPTSPEGRFATAVQARPGENAVTLSAVDPAGNRTERRIAFMFRPAATVVVTLDPALTRDGDGTLLTQTDELAVNASTDARPGAAVRLVGAGGTVIAGSVVANDGTVSVTVPAVDAATAYRLEVLSPDGAVEGQADLVARRDAVPPSIGFKAPPPPLTAAAALILEGTADDAVSLTLDGVATPVAEGRFSAQLALEPGVNTIEIVARDRAGNVQVRQITVTRDIDPPVVAAAKVTRPKGAGGPVEITAEVREAGGLRPIGAYAIAVDGVRESGLLRCDPGTNRCRTTLPARSGTIELLGISVEDYAGNKGGALN